jgi:hypothetical protein
MMSFFPSTPVEKWWTYGTMAVLAILWILWRPNLYPIRLLRFDDGNDYDLKLVEWERERVLNLAKGMAGTAITYLAALIPVVFKSDFGSKVPAFAIVGIIAGFMGSLILACNMTIATSRFTRFPSRFGGGPRHAQPPQASRYAGLPPSG